MPARPAGDGARSVRAATRHDRFAATLARLRRDVDTGAIAADGLLPGERDLAARLGVSRTTLRRMLAGLVEEGVLAHRQGVGTFVAPRPPDAPAGAAGEQPSLRDAAPLAGFTAAVLRLGRQPSSRDVVRRLTLPLPHDVMLMACEPDELVVSLRRVRCVDGTPVARERAVLPRWALPDAVAVGGSLYAALGQSGIAPVRTLQRIEAGEARPDEAEALGLVAGRAVVRLHRTDFLADGRCCAYTRTVLRAAFFDLAVHSRGAGLPLGLTDPDP